MKNVVNVGLTTNPIDDNHADRIIKYLKKYNIKFDEISFKIDSPNKYGILFINSSHKGTHMVNFIKKYEKHYNLKQKSFICLIDNHESKCTFADKVLRDSLVEIKSPKSEVKKIKDIDGERELTNSSEDEEKEEKKDESYNQKLDKDFYSYKMFNYVYTEKNLSYKK